MGNLICFSNQVCQNLNCFQITCIEQPLHGERCRWLNVAHVPEKVWFNSGINLRSAVHAITSLNSLPTLVQYAIIRPLQHTIKMCCFEISLRSKRGIVLLLTFVNPTKDVEFGPYSPLHRVQQFHTTHSLQLLWNPVSKT